MHREWFVRCAGGYGNPPGSNEERESVVVPFLAGKNKHINCSALNICVYQSGWEFDFDRLLIALN